MQPSIRVRSVEQIYQLWDEALGARDIEAAAALYAEDTRLESPLVRHLTGSERGVIEGRDRLRDFLRVVFDRTPPSRRLTSAAASSPMAAG